MLPNLTAKLNWDQIVALRSERRALDTGFAAAREMLYIKDGPVGARAATALPTPGANPPSQRMDPLDTANTVRPRELDPISAPYIDYMDEMVFAKEEFDQLVVGGKIEEKVDECFDACYERILSRLTEVFSNPETAAIAGVRGADNTLEPWASATHSMLAGADQSNLQTTPFALTVDNVRTAQTRLHNQMKLTREASFSQPRFLVSGDSGELYRITQSELASGAMDANRARLLTPVHLPLMTDYWALLASPKEAGITLEFAAGREPWVSEPAEDRYKRISIVYGVKFAVLIPSFVGSYFCEI